EVDPVLLERDGVLALRRRDDLEVVDVEFDAARRAVVLARRAADLQGRLLAEPLEAVEDLLADLLLVDDRLDDPGAVAQVQEVDLALAPLLVEPPAQLDALALVACQLGDGGERGHEAPPVEAFGVDHGGDALRHEVAPPWRVLA